MLFKDRKKRNMPGKRVIGDTLRRLSGRDQILLDPSTTALSIVKALRRRGKKDLTISLPTPLEVLVECAEDSDWEVISTGGNTPGGKICAGGGRKLFVGIESFHADKAIISCKGSIWIWTDGHQRHVFSGPEADDVKNATRRILAVDYTKFDQIGFSLDLRGGGHDGGNRRSPPTPGRDT